MILFFPFFQDGNREFEEVISGVGVEVENDPNMGHDQDRPNVAEGPLPVVDHVDWFEEELESDLKWSFALNRCFISFDYI